MAKSTKLETWRRVETVRLLILKGVSTRQIVQSVTQTFGVKDRMAFRYIALAREAINDVVAENRDTIYAEHIAARRDLRRRARDSGNEHLELSVLQDEAKLFGLYPSVKHDITSGGKPIALPTDVTDAERADRVKRLLEAAEIARQVKVASVP